jgi:hypothetical protein
MPAKGKRLAGAFCTIFAQTSSVTYQDQPLGTPASLSSCSDRTLCTAPTDGSSLVAAGANRTSAAPSGGASSTPTGTRRWSLAGRRPHPVRQPILPAAGVSQRRATQPASSQTTPGGSGVLLNQQALDGGDRAGPQGALPRALPRYRHQTAPSRTARRPSASPRSAHSGRPLHCGSIPERFCRGSGSRSCLSVPIATCSSPVRWWKRRRPDTQLLPHLVRPERPHEERGQRAGGFGTLISIAPRDSRPETDRHPTTASVKRRS